MNKFGTKLAIYTSTLNEEAQIGKVISRVAALVEVPTTWVIVDDGSTDNTLKILKDYESKYNWIKILTMPKKNTKNIFTAGEAWRKAITYLNSTKIPYDYYSKLDADTIIPSDYYQELIGFFERNPKYKVVSGRALCVKKNADIKKNPFIYKQGVNKLIGNYAIGCCFLVEGTFFRSIPFDFFPDFSHENYLNAKAKMLGFKSGCLDVPVYHIGKVSKCTPYRNGQMSYYFNQNFAFVTWLSIAYFLNKQNGVDVFNGYFDAKKKRWQNVDPAVRVYYIFYGPIFYNRFVFTLISKLRNFQ